MYIGISIACIIWSIKGFKDGIFKRTGKINLAIILYLSSCLLAVVFSQNWIISFFGGYKQHCGLLSLIVYLGCFYLSANFINKENIRIVFRYLITLGICCCLYGVAQKAGYVTFQSLPVYGRIYSTFGQPVFFGCFISMLIPIVLYEINETKKICLYFILGLFIFCLFIAQARSGLIATTLVSLLLLFHYKKNKKIFFAVIIVFILIFVIGAYVGNTEHAITNLYSRFIQKFGYTDRIRIYKESISVIKVFPVFGIGQDNIRPHNLFIDHLATLGIVGLFAFFYLCFSIFKGFTFYETDDLSQFYTLFGSCLAYLIFRQFNPGYIPVTLLFSMLTGSIYGIKNIHN
jgi:O-antigen ligase